MKTLYFQSKNQKPSYVCIGVPRQVGTILLYGLPRFFVFVFSFVIVLVLVRFACRNFYFYIVFVFQIALVLVFVLTERSAIVLVFVFVTKIALVQIKLKGQNSRTFQGLLKNLKLQFSSTKSIDKKTYHTHATSKFRGNIYFSVLTNTALMI